MRACIVSAARALFLDAGIAAVSMRNIANSVGCSPMWLYRYFGSKQAILREVWQTILDELFQQLDKLNSKDPATDLDRLAQAYMKYWLEQPNHFRLVFLNDERVFGEADPEGAQDMARRYKLFEDAFTRAQAAGHIRAGASKPQAEGLLAVMHGLIFNLVTVTDYPWQPQKTLAEHTVRAYLDGLAA
jgi:AcrR family transcriptional regulator